MIDVNLLGKKPKVKPERPSIFSRIDRTKAIVLGGAVVLLGMYWIFGDTIAEYFYTSPVPQIDLQQAPLDSLKRVSAERRLAEETEVQETETPEEAPVETEPVPVPAIPWNYPLSIEHIDAFTAFVHALPLTTDYNVIVVNDNGIIAELETKNEENIFDVQTAITNALPRYTFDFRPNGSLVQVWGSLKPSTKLSDVSPSSDYATPESNLSALNTITEENNVTIRTRGKTTNTVRENVLFLPVWIKILGSENNILNYLNDIKDKRLLVHITKISGYSKDRSQRADTSVLNFHFEIIM